MLNGNGHTNGHKQALNGEAAVALKTLMPSTDGGRNDVRMLIGRAASNLDPFLSSPESTQALIKILEAVAADPTSRQRVRASEVLLKAKSAAIDQIIRLAEVSDKIGRLDAGESTDIVTHYEVRIPEARARLE